jgi:subtilisin family serine protease
MSDRLTSFRQAVNATVETLEDRRLMSAVPGSPEFFAARGFVPAMWNGQEVMARPGQWLMKVDGVRGQAAQQIKAVNALLGKVRKDVKAVRQLGENGLVLVQAPTSLAPAKLRTALSRVPGLRGLEPDMAVWSAGTLSNDPNLGSLWGLHNTGQTGGTADADIDAPEAWSLTRGNGSVVIGVVDSGVDYNHPDLAANMWRNPGEIAGDGIDNDGNGYVDDVHGWDFFNNDNNPMDDNGHGTHVAGTIAGIGNNGTGVAGVNWNAKVLALKFLGSDGSGSLSAVVSAMNYATKLRSTHGINIRVLNHSWVTGGYSSTLYSAFKNAGSAGILSVAAAGNGGSDQVGDNNDTMPMYPASFDLDSVVAVAATDHRDQLASFSNFGGTSVDLAAPGVSILSTVLNGGYAWYSGTSMAAPHVAGAAALAWSYSPGASYLTVRSALLKGVDVKTGLNGKAATSGRLNAYGTLMQLPAAPVAPSGLAAAVISGSQINLSWADNSANESGFHVYRSSDGVNFARVATLGANTTGFASTGLTAGMTYHYRVTAYNGTGESAASNTASATTPSLITAPVAPTSLAAVAVSSSRINLNWADASSDEAGFNIYRSTNGGLTFALLATVGSNATAFVDTTVLASTAYQYRVRAHNAAGESADSNTASVTTPAALTTPAAPSNLVARLVSRNRVALTWTDNASTEDGFRVERSTDGTRWSLLTTVGANTTSLTDGSVKRGVTYYYRVAAFNAAGLSAYAFSGATTAAVASLSSATVEDEAALPAPLPPIPATLVGPSAQVANAATAQLANLLDRVASRQAGR